MLRRAFFIDMSTFGIQLDDQGHIRVNADGAVILSQDGAPCCCGDQDDGRLYVRAVDCCNIRRVLWVLQTMAGGCSVIRRTGGDGSAECWTIDRTQTPLTARQIRDLFTGDPIDAPTDPTTPYPCGTCGVEPCPTCPDCCMSIQMPVYCEPQARCCVVGRKFRLRYDVQMTAYWKWMPFIFNSPSCGGLVAREDMFNERTQTFTARGSMIVERVRNGNTCDPPTITCEGGSFTRTTTLHYGPDGTPTLNPDTCVLTVPPRVLLFEQDYTTSDCPYSPFDPALWPTFLGLAYSGLIYAFNYYGPDVGNLPCYGQPGGGVYPPSGSWSGRNDTSDWRSGASYTRQIAQGCAGLNLDELYDENYNWTGLPGLVYIARGTNHQTFSIEIIDPECGRDPCNPPSGGGAGNTLLRGGEGGAIASPEVRGCSGCGGAGLESPETIAQMLRGL